MNRKIQWPLKTGVLVTGVFLAGCGTATTKAIVPSTRWKTIIIYEGSIHVQARVPTSWMTHIGATGAGGMVLQMSPHWIGPHSLSQMGLTLGNPYHWYSPKPLMTQNDGQSEIFYKRLNARHNYVWVQVANNAADRRDSQSHHTIHQTDSHGPAKERINVLCG